LVEISDRISVELVGLGIELKKVDDIRIQSSFLTPCDTWSFSLSDQDVGAAIETLAPGTLINFRLNGKPVLSGRVDETEIESHSEGNTLTVEGRDMLWRAADATMDPRVKFTGNMTLIDAIGPALSMIGIETIYTGEDLNIALQTGSALPPSTTTVHTCKIKNQSVSIKEICSSHASSLKGKLEINCKPNSPEGVFQFIARVLKRHGLAMWASADGTGVVIGKPDFDQAPGFIVRNSRFTGSNATGISCRRNVADLPSCIVATNRLGGAEESKVPSSVIIFNELTAYDAAGNLLPQLEELKKRYPGAKVLPPNQTLLKSRALYNTAGVAGLTPIILKDTESKTGDQVEAFVRGEMAERQHKALQYRATLPGLTQNGKPWATNTMVSVSDELSGVYEPLWVMSRSFSQSRKGGTHTEVTLIKPYTLQLSE
jgi:prophage tail gpP-like protein